MLNKLVHETRGKCWHEYTKSNCDKCNAGFNTTPPNPDYENDMDACMDILEGSLWECGSPNSGQPFAWVDHYFSIAETPQLAIIHAYLKSKGVELGEDK
jgi:hypothetical protein